MSFRVRGLILVVLAGLLLDAWNAFGPFLISHGPYHWSVTPSLRAIAFVSGALWVAVVALTFRRDPAGRMWKLLLVYVAVQGTWVFGYVADPIGFTMAGFLGPLSAAVLLHLVLAFPGGRLRDRADRWLVGLVYVIVLPVQLLGYLVWDPRFVCAAGDYWCPHQGNVLLVAANDDLHFLITRVALLSPVLAVLGIAEVVRHWRQASPAGRRVIAPVAFGMPLVFLVLGFWWLAPALGRDDIQDFVLANSLFDFPTWLTPILFLVGTVRARLSRGSIADLAVELGGGIPVGGLRDALARTLRDPTLQLAFAAPSGSGLVDPEGRPFEMPSSPDRTLTRLERDGELLAMLVHDPEIDREDAGLVAAAGSVARLALENERLSAQVRAQLDEVRASRQRIVEAGDAERRRVERDLHDGAQQRLVALAMRLEAARSDTTGAQALIDATAAELGVAIAEVRQLARGLHPAILTEAGLRAAIESLAERTRVPVEVDGDETRYAESVEATAYFLVAEALTNVARHANATHATVTLRTAGNDLMVEVRDDGRGGADPASGSGLRGLADRVAAAGGALQVESPLGGGTTVRALIPLSLQQHA